MAYIIKYPYDPTGKSSTNLISGETVNLPRVRNRAFAPKGGLFFVNSMRILHLGTGKYLKPKDDFVCLGQHQEATMKVRKEIASVVYVTNSEYADDFSYEYQVLGGELYTVVEAIQQWIEALELDGRAVHWDNILGKPLQMPPTPHLHHVNDMYGFEHLIDAIKELVDSNINGDQELKALILDQLARLQETVTAVDSQNQQILIRLGQLTDRITALEN